MKCVFPIIFSWALSCYFALVVIEQAPKMVLHFKEQKKTIIDIEWSNDGEKLAGLVLENILLGTPPLYIYIWDLRTDTVIAVDHIRGFDNYDPAWHPLDNQLLLYASDYDFGDYYIGILNIETMEREPILQLGRHMDWFSDGDSFLADNGFKLYIIDKSGEYRDIWKVESDHLISGIAISPDGKTAAIVLGYSFSEKEDQLLILNLDDFDQQVVYESKDHIANPDWSPDGQILSFVVEELGKRYGYAINIEEQCLTDKFPLAESVEDIAWSPQELIVAVPIMSKEKGIYFIEIGSDFFQEWLSSGGCSK
jgi:Tol biopolymer transport system component